jgi:Protein of unknown function DUF262
MTDFDKAIMQNQQNDNQQTRMPDILLSGSTRNWTMEHYLVGDDLEKPTSAIGWLKLPSFQRPFVWTLEQQIRFIESIWHGLDIGRFCYTQDYDDFALDSLLIDGQQRMTTIFKYVRDEFKVFGLLYSELHWRDFMRFGDTLMPTVVIVNKQHAILDEGKLLELYNRMNYGGTNHD